MTDAIRYLIRIDVLLGSGWQSDLIAWWGQGPGGWSHIASVLMDGRYLDARDDKLAGVKSGVHIREPASEAWVKKVRCTLEVTKDEYEAWEANLRAKIGDKYASWDIAGFFLDKMLHKVATYDCSALVINALQHIKKIVFPLPLPAHEITPNTAFALIAQAGFLIGEVQTHV